RLACSRPPPVRDSPGNGRREFQLIPGMVPLGRSCLPFPSPRGHREAPGAGVVRMTRAQLLACTRKQLADMARQQGITGWHATRKEDLVAALEARYRKGRRKLAKPARSKPLVAPVQPAAARNTSPEEQAESSKFDVGVPTRDLSARVPRDLPA